MYFIYNGSERSGGFEQTKSNDVVMNGLKKKKVRHVRSQNVTNDGPRPNILLLRLLDM
jgi:hypothetical protein